MQESVPLAASLGAVWAGLCEDAGVSVLVADREGRVLHANRSATRWLHWHRRRLTGESRPGEPFMLEDFCPPAILEERLALGQRVCDSGEAVCYESLLRGNRYCVTMRPIPTNGGANLVLAISRRLRAWERAGRDCGGDAECVEVKRHDPGTLAALSSRELEVLILIAEGLSYAEIAERLHRSVRTIERHRDRLGQKLGAANRVQIARFAFRAGLSDLPTPPEAEELRAANYDPLEVSPPIRKVTARRSRGPG